VRRSSGRTVRLTILETWHSERADAYGFPDVSSLDLTKVGVAACAKIRRMSSVERFANGNGEVACMMGKKGVKLFR